MDITGKWKGTIVYGPEYDDWEGKELYFKMHVAQTGDIFRGTAHDTSGTGVNPDEASITGFVEGEEVSFMKQYRSTITYDENGNEVLQKGKPSLEIEYWGTYDPDTQTVEGQWEINIFVQQPGGQWLDETWTGYWSMKRF